MGCNHVISALYSVCPLCPLVTEPRQQGKWGDRYFPKRNWICLSVDDAGRDNTETCEVCETAQIRYVHTMSHADYPSVVRCGCVCAEYLEEDTARPREREKWARKRTRWLTSKRWYRTKTGNDCISSRGTRVVICPEFDRHENLLGYRPVIIYFEGYYDSQKEKLALQETADLAKLAAFNHVYPAP